MTAGDPFDLKYQRSGKQMDVIHRSKEQRFAFDHVFTQQSTEDIFHLTAKDMVEETTNGFKACIFAYGATGSGKTFTMMGDDDHKGMIEVTLEVSTW